MRNRDYLFDNLKILLIFLVVMTHCYGMYSSASLTYFYNFVYMFHMPVFIFVSGYFSKNIEKGSKNVNKFILPFILTHISLYCISLMMGNSFNIRNFLFAPYSITWYLFCLIVWKKVLKYLIKIKYVLPLSFIMGIFIGFVPINLSYFAIGRLFTFLPFFLMGYLSNGETILKIKKIPKVFTALTLGIIAYISTITIGKIITIDNWYLKISYWDLNVGVNGAFYRITIYVLAIIIGVCIINLISDKENALSYLGERTITIYLGHYYFIYALFFILSKWNVSIIGNIIIIVSPIVFTLLLGNKYIYRLYNKIFG